VHPNVLVTVSRTTGMKFVMNKSGSFFLNTSLQKKECCSGCMSYGSSYLRSRWKLLLFTGAAFVVDACSCCQHHGSTILSIRRRCRSL